jgi:predicted metal-binding membrane protein
MSAARTTGSTRRFPGKVLSSSSPAAALSRRDRFLIQTSIVLITLLAWAYLVHIDRQMSADMEHDKMMAAMGMTMDMPWSAADAFFTFAMWAVMMVGMMTPSASPMLLLFAATRAGRGKRGVSLATLTFGLGYIVVWAGFSVGAAAAQWGLHQATMLSAAMASSSGRLNGAILIAAGAYQLTPWKSKCLTHCRSPLGFLMTNWRDGTTGAFQMGFLHGAYCLGCCWALMCVLFVVGVMNLIWVAALTGFVLIEKTGPAGAIVARVAGAAIVALGIAVIS